MPKTPTTELEKKRLESLYSYAILDTLDEDSMNDITRLASEICQTPICAISLIDQNRQWFKSKVGLTVNQTSRDIAFCSHAIEQNKIFTVADAKLDSRFSQNPLVTGEPKIRFYAGAPLLNSDGYNMGTLCVIDTKPRVLTAEQSRSLVSLAKIVIDIFEARKKNLTSQRISAFFELSRDFLAVVNLTGYFIKLNHTWNQKLGWSLDELTSKPYIDFVHPEDVQKTLAVASELNSTNLLGSFTNRYRSKDGSYLTFEWSVVLSEADQVMYASARDITQIQAEQLTTSLKTKQIESLFQNMGEGMVLQDAAGKIIEHNEAALKILGLNSDELHGRTSTDPRWRCLKPDGSPFRGEDHPAMVALSTAEPQKQVPMIVHRKDGGSSLISINAVPLFRGAEPKPFRVLSTFADLTPLQVAQLKLENTLKFVPTGIFRTDLDGNCIFVNDSWTEATGLSFQEARGQGWIKAIHPDDKKNVFDEWEKSVKEKRPFDLTYRFLKPDGTITVVQGRSTLENNFSGEPIGYLGDVQDITALHHTQEFNTFYKIALDEAAIVAFTDAKGKITYANEMFCEISGYTRNEIIGKDHRILNSGLMSKDFFAEMWKTISSGKQWQGEICNKAKNGSLYWVNTTIVPFLNNKGKVEKYIAIRRNITQEKLQRIELGKAYEKAEQATRAKSDFLYTMSHEIRTPLNGVIGMTALLTETDLSSEQREFAETISTSGKSLLSIINDILDFSKIEAGKMDLENTEFDLVGYMNSLVKPFQMIAKRKNIEFELVQSPLIYNVITDDGHLGQVITNLVANAIKFTHVGKVKVKSHVQQDQHKSRIILSISDTGIGLPEKAKDRMFHAFSQAQRSSSRQYGGTGLGLSISKRLIEMMGGRIYFDSMVGIGSKRSNGARFCVSG